GRGALRAARFRQPRTDPRGDVPGRIRARERACRGGAGMNASAVTQTSAGAGPSLFSRVYGFGSVYAKTLRDSRLTFLIVTGLTSGLVLGVGAALGKDLASPSGRADLVALVKAMPPIVAGLAGNPVNVGTLGGYMSWKYGPFFALILSIWLILSLSGTLAGETHRGRLDVI